MFTFRTEDGLYSRQGFTVKDPWVESYIGNAEEKTE